MIKKGLVTLVCLTVMSALWSWAATTYSISTKINSLGTKALYDDNNQFLRYTSVIGGTISVDNKAEQDRGVKYTNYTTTSRVVTVVVDPKPGYKISALTKNGTSVSVGANQTTPVPVEFVKPLVLKTQTLVATFAVESVGAVQSRTWQLQIQNQNGGGKLSVTRGVTPAVDYTSIGKPLVKNYLDTTPVSVLVDAADGYRIDYILVNGQKITILTPDAQIVPIDPKEGSRVRSVVAAYKKKPLAVTTDVIEPSTPNPGQIGYIPNGIAPINPNADVYGNVRLIVTPTGSNNIVDFITVAGRKVLVSDPTPAPGTVVINRVTLTDRFGDVATLPNRGAVKVTISGITSAITVTATYKKDNTLEMGSCTKTCHLQSSNAVVLAVPDTWKASAHYKNAVDCVTCHQTMPGTVIKATVSATSFLNLSSNSAGAEGASYCASCHNNTKPLSGAHAIAFAGSCSSCHTTVHNPDAVGCDSASCHAATAVVTDWAAGAHGTASGHNTGTCQRCHATEGAIVGATVGWTGSYTNVLKAYSSTVWRNNAPAASSNGISCAVCHDPHGGLRAINTYNGAVIAFDPNQNGSNNDQFDVCTSCHTMQDNTGAQTDMYHEKSSISVGRMIADSHYDNPLTPAAGATAVVEGYVVRTKSANPCADCHNLHSADLTVQEAWAKSAHAGKIATNKETAAGAAALAWFNAKYPTNTATAYTDSKTVGTSTRTVLEFYQRDAAGVAFYKTVGAKDDAAGNAWTHYDWDKSYKADGTDADTAPDDDRVQCQRCHTATGIANFLTNPATYNAANNNFSHLSGWTTLTGSPQNELLYCWGCHSDSQSGALRNLGAITEVYAAATAGNAAGTATVAYPNVGKSNVCMACHVGREIGQNVANDNDADGIRGFINSHYLAAGATIFNESGYEYAGQSYANLGYHKNVGMNDAYNTGTEGPCVTCHMTSAEGHSFEVSAASTTCVNCHGNLTAAALEASEHEFHLALDELNKALIAKGIEFKPAHPYFYQTGTAVAFDNWAGVYGLSKWKDVMGAAFNYNLLEHDPGAYAHNRQYALKLIKDSIDFLADGAVDGNGVSAAFTAAAANKEFAELTSHTAAISATATPVTTCADCHQAAPHYGGAPFHQAQYVSTASQPVSCANCHGEAVNTAANQAILAQYADSAHTDPDGEAWIHYDWRGANRSSCARCHNGTAFVAKLGKENDTSSVFLPGDILKPGEALACSACHTDAGTGDLRTAAQDFVQAFTLNLKNGATVTYDVAGASTLCARCHSGRETGESIKADANTTGVSVFVDSHYQPVTGVVYNQGGYEYAGQVYDSLGKHKLLGAAGQGPCVTCHMEGKDHSFVAPSCVTCHNGTTAPAVNAATVKANYDLALNNLKLALEAKGIHYGPVHPFFFTAPYVAGAANAPVTNWGSAYGPAAWKDTMGAAFNYNMLWSDKGAFAHNNGYAMKLIADSIDFLEDGAL